MPRLAWILLLILSTIWGASFLSARIAAPTISPLTLVFIRVGIAALALHVFLHVRGRRMPSRWQDWRDYAVMGLLGNIIPFALIFFGTATISASLASILNATTPIFTVVVAHFVTHDEKMTLGKTAGVILGFTGVAVMLGFSSLQDLGMHFFAELACAAAGFFYALSAIWGRRFRGHNPVETASGQLTASAVIALPLAFLLETPWTLPVPSLPVIAAVLFISLIATAFAYVLYFRVLTLAGSNVTLVTFLVPISSIVLGALILGERLEAHHWAGMGLIMIGLAAIDGRLTLRRGLGKPAA